MLNHPIADRSGVAGVPLKVKLSAAFGVEPIDEQVVRFTSQITSGGIPLVLDMALFSNRTPVTRQNFLKYVADGDYVNSFIHRSVPGFVIQSGGYRINAGGASENVPTDAPILNEFGISNTLGTISMAKQGGDPNSATSQWFVSLAANSDILDPQNGGFTVFGRATRGTFATAQTFGNPTIFPIYNYGGPFTQLPMLPPDELIEFPGVSLAPLPDGQAGEDVTLTYSVVSNSNPAVATAAIESGGSLLISPVAGQAGNTSVTVRATDSVGNVVDDRFVLSVNLEDSYGTWASRSVFPGGQSGVAQDPDGDGWSNLQEYAFLGQSDQPDSTSETVVQGAVGSAASEFKTLTFPVRKFTQGLAYAVEANDGLSGPWVEVWKSADGFLNPRIVSVLDQVDRVVVTIKDISPVSSSNTRFLRIRTVQE